jgi:hypothetical protein
MATCYGESKLDIWREEEFQYFTANLAAFLTVDQLDTSITSVADLVGTHVATFPTYKSRLNRNHHIPTVTSDGALSVRGAVAVSGPAAAGWLQVAKLDIWREEENHYVVPQVCQKVP